MYNPNISPFSNSIGAPQLGLPHGLPVLGTGIRQFVQPPPQPQNMNLKRAINYLADYGGCGYYRCIAPNTLLNLYEKAVITESTAMILDPRFYETVETVKVQRQATIHQKQFIEGLKQLRKQNGDKLKLIYEIDDVVFSEDIPLFNRNRGAFTDPAIRQNILDIISLVDEVTVTTEYFKEYIKSKTNHTNVSAIPNYLMKWWFDRYYNLGDLVKNFEKNKKKPIISIFASGTHVDVMNVVNQQDDFASVVQHIIKSRTDFKWRFYGSHPFAVTPFIQSGEMEFYNWTKLPDYPSSIAESGTQITFACLEDNNFNRCKSNIKFLEAAAMGIPCVCPDMVTYKDAHLKYSNGDEFIDCIKEATKNQSVYADYCKKARAFAEENWLEDDKNLMKHYEAYFTPYGSSDRKYLL